MLSLCSGLKRPIGLHADTIDHLLNHLQVLPVISFKLHLPRSLKDGTMLQLQTARSPNRSNFTIYHALNLGVSFSPRRPLEVQLRSEVLGKFSVYVGIPPLNLLHCVTLPHQVLDAKPWITTHE